MFRPEDYFDLAGSGLEDLFAGVEYVWEVLTRIEEWLGREALLRQRRAEVAAQIQRAREEGDVANGALGTGQVAGLIDAIVPAGEIVRTIVQDAERIIRERLPGLVAGAGAAAGRR